MKLPRRGFLRLATAAAAFPAVLLDMADGSPEEFTAFIRDDLAR